MTVGLPPMPRLLNFLLSIVVLAAVGCAPRGEFSFLEGATGGKDQEIFVATQYQQDQPLQNFGARRSKVVNYAAGTISIPPVHEVGQIEWPRRAKPDPKRHFVVTSVELIDSSKAFARKVRAADDLRTREILLFIHGYNTNIAEASYRLAQIKEDFDAPMPSVLYAWPSAGVARGYAYDRDSVIFARDGLEQLIRDLTDSGGYKITLLAHSLGTHLVMETLRQMAIADGSRSVNRRISSVALMSPDIDQDVFEAQVARIGKLPDQFAVLTTRQDRALGLMGWLTGRRERLGTVTDSAALRALGVEVVDVSQFADSSGLNHSVAVSSPEAIRFILGLIEQSDGAVNPGP